MWAVVIDVLRSETEVWCQIDGGVVHTSAPTPFSALYETHQSERGYPASECAGYFYGPTALHHVRRIVRWSNWKAKEDHSSVNLSQEDSATGSLRSFLTLPTPQTLAVASVTTSEK